MVKKLVSLLLSAVLMCTTAISAVYGESENSSQNIWKEFYVAENGNDTNDGSREHPFLTIKKAKETVSEISDSMTGDIIVNITSGTYRIDETLDFTNADSGKNGYQIIYRGDKNNKPVISGGRVVDNFKRSENYPGLYEAYLPGYEKYGIREMYVNDSKRFVAKSERYITPVGNYIEENSTKSSDGMIVSKKDIPKFDNPEDVKQTDFVWSSMWIKSMCNPISIVENPKNRDTMIVKLSEELNSEYAGPKVKFQIENCIGVLDRPGEFYYNERTSMLYYMPYSGEKIESTQFVVPNLEFCMFFIGDGVSYPIKNITVENIKFEHFTRLFNDNHYATGQADVSPTYNRSSLCGNTRGAIYVMRADNINFIDNIFCNLGDSAINLYTAVSNCKIEGNVFYDLGGAAMKIGTSLDNETSVVEWDSDLTPEENPKTDYLLMHMSPYITASNNKDLKYLHTLRYSMQCFCIVFNKTSVQDMYLYKKRPLLSETWKSGEVKDGEKAFVLYDFAKAYSFSEIALCFNPDAVSDTEKNNYEILLSNDEDFTEGSYVTVAVQNSPAEEIARYNVDTNEKFRYLMVRKLDSSPFALSFLYPFSKDYPHDILMKRCENVTVRNNYIKRVSDEWTGDPAIIAKTCNNLELSNNEISDIPYTGINWGWGWQSHLKNGWATIKNNYVHDVCGSFYDGGCFYIFGGCHIGDNRTIVKDNWLKAYRGRGIYNDNGCMGVDMADNVIEYASSPVMANDGAVGNNMGTIYSPIPVFTTLPNGGVVEKAYDSIKGVVPYPLGDDTAETYRIKSEAGLTDEYAYLKNYVPDAKPVYELWGTYGMNDADAVKFVRFDYDALIEMLNYTLKNGVFGEGYGMYPSHIKAEIENVLSENKNFTDGEKVLEMRLFAEYVEKSFNRVDYAEMLEICKNKLANTKCVTSLNKADKASGYGTVLKPAKDKFESEITDVVSEAENADKTKLFELTKKLEAAYNEFCESVITPEITDVYSKNLSDFVIDKENKKVILQLPKYAGESDTVSFGAAQNTLLPNSFGKPDYSKEVQLPLYSKNTKLYDMWTVRTEEPGKNYGKLTPDGFSSFAEKFGVSKAKLSDGGVSYESMQDDFCWYSNTDINNTEENEFKFSLSNARECNSVTFLVAADTLNDFYRNSKLAKHDRMELLFENSKMYVYTVKNGERILNYSGVSEIDYKGVNTVKYKINPCDGYSVLNLSVNGKTYNIACSDEILGSSFGFYSDSLPVVLY